ncbi:MAG: archaeosortase/exosortase family protein [Lentimicrobiaceae bacterium]|nr:archaeosortase/exosortase family protein [Lentimicrobiaceae bacterium]
MKIFYDIKKEVDDYLSSKKILVVKDVLIFIIITLTIHFLYRFWANKLDHRIFGLQIITPAIFNFFKHQLFLASLWVDVHLLGYQIKTANDTLFFTNNGYISITAGCSGVKQFLQWILLMLLFPGQWKHKAWFIPAGLIMIYLTNIFRIVGLSYITLHHPDIWHFSHDNIFRPLFYVVIFSMWVLWVEKFKTNKNKKV